MNKPTDEQILEKFEKVVEFFIGNCYYNETVEAMENALDLINRQKAEIEKLCIEIDDLIIAKDLLFDEAEALIKKAKAEAIKEFAERLRNKAKKTTITYVADTSILERETGWIEISLKDFDDLVKEMEEENE